MKKAKIMTIAMILMLGLGACGNNKAGSAESAVSTENAQTVSETGSESLGKLMAGDETYQYVLDRNSGKLTMAGKEAGKRSLPEGPGQYCCVYGSGAVDSALFPAAYDRCLLL